MVRYDRGERLAQVKRLKQKRKSYWGNWAGSSARQLGRVSQYPKICSCHKCCNAKGLKAQYRAELMLHETSQ